MAQVVLNRIYKQFPHRATKEAVSGQFSAPMSSQGAVGSSVVALRNDASRNDASTEMIYQIVIPHRVIALKG